MNNIGYVSAVALLFTLIAIVLILVISFGVLNKTPEQVREEDHIELKDEDREYVYFNPWMVPVVCATFNSLFEGNQ